MFATLKLYEQPFFCESIHELTRGDPPLVLPFQTDESWLFQFTCLDTATLTLIQCFEGSRSDVHMTFSPHSSIQ